MAELAEGEEGRRSPPRDLTQLAREPIFVGGHVRSGTTWVYDLLTSHELVAGVFESWLFSPLHGVGGVFAPEQWDKEATGRMESSTGRPFGLKQMVSREEVAGDVRHLVEGWMARVLEPQHRFIVEKTPPHLLGMSMISEVFPRAKFVHVIRDGRDVAVSLRAAARSWNPGFRTMQGRRTFTPARGWRQTVSSISSAGSMMGDRYTEITYETLTRDPTRSLTSLLDFCEIPHDAEAVREIIEMNRFDARYEASDDSFRRKGQIGDWESEFSLVDAIAFDLGGGGLLVERGYEKDRRWWMRRRRALTRN